MKVLQFLSIKNYRNLMVIIPAVLQAGFFAVPSTAQQNPFFKHLYSGIHVADSFSLPGKQYLYSANDSVGWQLEIFSSFVYRENGLTDTNLNYYQEGGDPFNRITYAYDMFSRLIGLTIENYDSGFSNTSRFEYAYDELGNPTEEFTYIWFSNDWKVGSGKRKVYVYDPDQNIITIEKQTFNVLQGWLSDEKTDYLLDQDGLAREMITSDWLGFQWTRVSRLHSIEWQSYDGKSASGQFLFYQKDEDASGEWEPESRREYVYWPDGSYQYIEQVYTENGNWQDNIKYEEIRYPNGMLQEEKLSVWKDDQWVQWEGSSFAYTYHETDLLEILIQAWDTLLAQYVNSKRWVFDDFIYFQEVEENEQMKVALKVFPNPAGDVLFLDVTQIDPDKVILLDAMGRTVLIVELTNERRPTRVDISGLGRGMFLLVVLKDGKVLGSGKVVKE